jgi:DNA helicase-2/ATP-dependent DNA helicase PcrA
MINRLAVSARKDDAYKVASAVAMDSGIYLFYKNDTSIEGQARTANVEELLNGVKVYIDERHAEMLEEMQADGQLADGTELTAEDFPPVTLIDYLENVSLLSAVDVEDDEDGNNKISLMTVHSSKGLEYPYVFVAGMEENIFPSGGFLAAEHEIEEERRLFYVAMTRAKTALTLSFAETRMRNGKHESNSPSRFVREVDPKYIQNPLAVKDYDDDDNDGWGSKPSFGGGWKKPMSTQRSINSYGQSSRPVVQRRESTPARSPMPVKVSMPVRPTVTSHVPSADFTPTPVLQLKAGQRIEHNRFGYGRIVEISGAVTELKAKIMFDNHGEKILLLKYAKIRALND